MKFYLGTNEPHWLATVDVSLFVSRIRLIRPSRKEPKKFPTALQPWVLDSGAFTELATYGEWTLDAKAYARQVKLLERGCGSLAWAAPQDWMCEPSMLLKTGKTIAEHQRLTLTNFLELRQLLGSTVVPALQGWQLDDYLRHVEVYAKAGIYLENEPVVGLGSVCRRQASGEIGEIVRTLSEAGMRLHGFGVKRLGLKRYAEYLTSADSMAWSYNARRHPPLPGCLHRCCVSCPRFALDWREQTLQEVTCDSPSPQLTLC